MGRNGNGAGFFYVGTQPVGLLPKPEPTSFYKWVFFFFFKTPNPPRWAPWALPSHATIWAQNHGLIKKKGLKPDCGPIKKNYVCLDSSPPIKRKIMFAQIQAA